MKRVLLFAVCLIMVLMAGSFSAAEDESGIVAKVTTANKGPLKLRSEASRKSRILDEIPNGTCVLVSDRAPSCTQALPRVRTRVVSGDSSNRVICGCCMGEGCECCGFKGWIDY